jgi:inhibitor of cysteine peptidase
MSDRSAEIRRAILTTTREGYLRAIAAIVVCLALAGCWGGHLDPISNEADTAMISGTGTVRHQDIEGGFFGIVGDDSVKYDPVELPPAFQKDGLKVKFRAQPANATSTSTRMWGVRIELKSIDLLPPPPAPKSR